MGRVSDMSTALVMKRSMIGDETDDETVRWFDKTSPPIRYDKIENVKIWRFITNMAIHNNI